MPVQQVQDSGQAAGGGMMDQQLKNGKWIPAKEVPYPASLIEKVLHMLGKHYYWGRPTCALCGKHYKGE